MVCCRRPAASSTVTPQHPIIPSNPVYHYHGIRDVRPPVPLRMHHVSHLNILLSYAYHLVVLLHQRQALEPQSFTSVKHCARARCLESTKHLLQIHAAINETPELTPFRWYGRGVGSFHAFHAAALLIRLLDIASIGEDRDPYIKLLQGCLGRFNSLAEYSTLCVKAAPVLQVLLSNLLGRSAEPHLRDQSAILQQATPGYSMRNAVAPQGNATSDWDSFLWQMPAQNWLAPASLPWDDWSDRIQDPTMSALSQAS